MSWIPTLGGWGWLLAAVPLGIILLYFLKLRREPVEVPSTYLWSKTIEDLHVNSLLQRLRRSLLLLLQLLAVALAAIALFRPGIRGETRWRGRTVFLLDTSASMQATDLEEGETRFEKAKRLIAGRIETMSDSETAMLSRSAIDRRPCSHSRPIVAGSVTPWSECGSRIDRPISSAP